MRINYWSNSKLAKLIRKHFGFPPDLACGTSEEWKSYEKSAKSTNKFVNWFTNDFFDDVQDIVYKPVDLLDSFAYWVYNRFISPTHLINTRLKKGQWHETDEKIIHGMFEELVDFVEIQKAGMNGWLDKDEKIQRHVPWYDKHLPYFINKFFTTRSQHLGVNYLLWEISLRMDEEWFGIYPDSHIDKVVKALNDPQWMKPTPQANAALEILHLYCWWKFIRVNRSDPMDASGYTELFENKRKRNKESGDDSVWDMLSDRNEEEKEAFSKASELCHKIEEQYEDEDELMMINLVKVRRSLWT